MDQVTLVENQIDDGQKLVNQLMHAGCAVTAAAWVKGTEDGQWFLYIAAPVVESEGLAKAYRRVHAVIRQMPQPFWVDPFEVKLIGSSNPIAEALEKMQQRYPGGIRYRGTQLGGLSIEEAYIYPSGNRRK
jgi:hypothetical protein